MPKKKTLDVYCQNGHLLFGKYKKDKPGYLLKCYLDKIVEDRVGVRGLPNDTDVFCPECKIRIGRIGQVRGRPAVVINHGGVKRIKT
jgi:hypothetical protein